MAVGSSNDFDLVVLGAGTGGYTAAFRAGQLGLKVALVDEDKIGGTCLHRGCIPTKALLESAAFADRVRHAKDYGLVAAAARSAVDYAAMAARRDAVVKRMWTGLKTLVDKNKVTWVAGRGRLEGPDKVRVSQPGEDGTPGAGGERVLQATDVIIATGSRVKSLPGPRAGREAHRDQRRRPAHGRRCPRTSSSSARARSGVEFASMYADLGVKVTLLEYLPADRPARGRRGQQGPRAQLHQARDHGHDRAPASTPRPSKAGKDRGQPDGRARRARSQRSSARSCCSSRPVAPPTSRTSGSRRRRSRPIAASSRSTAGCGRRSRTSTRSATSSAGLWLAHTAAHEGIIAAHVIAGDEDVHEMDYIAAAAGDLLPAGDRLDRPDRGAGRARAQRQGRQGPVPGDRQGAHRRRVRGLRQGHRRHARHDDTLGVHIVGPHATDLIAEASLAFELEATPWEIGGATHAHPTLSEIIGEAALAVDGRSINF